MTHAVKRYSDSIKENSILLNKVVGACRSLLYNHPIASSTLNYLNNRVSKTNQEKFQFGYFPTDEYIDALTEQISKDKLIDINLLYKWFVPDGIYTTSFDRGALSGHNLIMPYKDAYGNTVALVGRSLLSEKEREEIGIPKYKTTVFTKSIQLFGLNLAKRSIIKNNSVIIVEGQIDCITAHEYGLLNVGALGGVAFTAYQFYLLRRYTKNIYLALDSDEEGQNSAKKIINRYGQLANFKNVVIPTIYKDLDEALRKSQSINSILKQLT